MLRIDHGVLNPFSEKAPNILEAKLLRGDLSDSIFQKKQITISIPIYVSKSDVLPLPQRGSGQAQAKPPPPSAVTPHPVGA